MVAFFWKILAREGNLIRIAKQRTPQLQCRRCYGVRKHRGQPEINADLNRLEAEMAERKPQRASSKRKILKKRLATLQGLEWSWKVVKGRIRSKAEHQKKKLKALEEEEEELDRRRAMNEEEIEEMRVFNESLNPLLATVLLGHRIQVQMEDEESVFLATSRRYIEPN